MRALTRDFVPAAILLIVGLVIWRTGRIEQRLTEARKQLLTLAFDSPAADYDAIEHDLRYLRAVPPVSAIESNLREQRAASRYWRGRYNELVLKSEAVGGVTERDPACCWWPQTPPIAPWPAGRTTPAPCSASRGC